ncbi:hypothetical protein VTJ83DRAFT_4854 [Remersonia thermophila]|uniref:Profilin n=1 Tax=Remersonia thermophila TaxID=72144 RepID=A0ABR4DB44_9PEZI
MSWQAYVDSSLLGTGHIDKAAIVSGDGDSTWAASPGFTLSADELSNIVAILKDINNPESRAVENARTDGIHVAGERYVAFRIEDQHIYGRKGKTGVCIVKTKQSIIIGHYDENIQAASATATVEALADYLIKAGY